MKILLIGTQSVSFYIFRKDLILTLLSLGHEVSVVISDETAKSKIESLGTRTIIAKVENTSKNPFASLRYKKELIKIIKENSFDAVFSFMTKPLIFGTLAAKKCSVKNIFCMLEGRGRAYSDNGLLNKLIRIVLNRLFRKSLKHADKLFVLNSDDFDFFAAKKIISPEKIVKLNGIGVDLEEFSQKEFPAGDIFLSVARLIPQKGITDFCRAAEIVRSEFPSARFLLYGSEDVIGAKDIEKFPAVEYMGTTDNISKIYGDCSVFVLPSYYMEGLPRSIMEAMATGRPVITTDFTGCRDTVTDGENGFLVPVKTPSVLAEKMKFMILNRGQAVEMGKKSRQAAEEKYDQRKTNEIICREIGAQQDA